MFVPVEDHHLFSVDLGQGTPIVLHDGWVASSLLWLPLIERMQRDWRCIAYDHRGTGSSTFPPSAITLDALVDDLFRVMDAHGVEKAVFGGESLGTIICLLAAQRDPSRCAGLVLVGGFPFIPPADPAPPADAPPVQGPTWEQMIDGFVHACLPEADSQHMHRFGCNTLLPAGAEAGATLRAALAGAAPDLAGITAPVLVVHGAADVIAPLAGGEMLAERLPNAELVVVADGGHVPIVTRPDVIASAIDDWWSRHRPG